MSVQASPVASEAASAASAVAITRLVTTANRVENNLPNELNAQFRKQQEIASLAAQITKQNHIYEARPRKTFAAASGVQASVVDYVDAWSRKLEQKVRNKRPVDASGNSIYGQLRVEVEIWGDGSLTNARLIEASSIRELNLFALELLKNAAPFARLPNDMVNYAGNRSQVLVISRKFIFSTQVKHADFPETTNLSVVP
ncbi:energy transducer TonB [Chitinibacter sp. S2-10]|uniref:energy transducer TonB family protein n=1 Tax=Chitinibacter sp. S2-10 TaxID=3373597 RepID=UPI0039778537